MNLSPEEVLVALDIEYKDDIIIGELDIINDSIEAKIKEIIPVAKVYLEAENR